MIVQGLNKTMLIKLTGKRGVGKTAQVDSSDYAQVTKYRWYLDIRGYSYKKGLNKNRLFMHQFIMGAYPDGKPEIDHIDGNKLNNRRGNLRFCTRAENSNNRRKYKNNTSGYKGISWNKQAKKWQCRLCFNSKAHYIGLYSDIKEAIIAVKQLQKIQIKIK